MATIPSWRPLRAFWLLNNGIDGPPETGFAPV